MSKKPENPAWTMAAMTIVALSVFLGKFVEGSAASNFVWGYLSVVPVFLGLVVAIALAKNGSPNRVKIGRFAAKSADWLLGIFAGLFFTEQWNIWVIPYPSDEIPSVIVFGIINMAGVIFMVAIAANFLRNWARQRGVW